jgi:hypothetical protein
MALIAVEQGVAEADHRLRRGAGLGRAAECGQRGDGGQYSNCMIADEPSGGGGVLGGGRLRHQHLEGERGERPRRHDQELLAFDQVLRIAEQALVQPVCAAQVEGERLARRIVGFGVAGAAQPGTGRVTPPRGRVETAAERRHLAPQQLCSEFAPHPARIGLGDNPKEGLLRRGVPFRCIKNENERFV